MAERDKQSTQHDRSESLGQQHPYQHIQQPYQHIQQPTQQPFQQAQMSPNNAQIMHQMEKMEIRMQYNQQITELKQSFMMDKLSNIPNYQTPPMLSYPVPQFTQMYPYNQPPNWGSMSTATPAFGNLQQAMGLTMPTATARFMYPNASGTMDPGANRYIANPQMQSREKPAPRKQTQNVSSEQKEATSQPKPQNQPNQNPARGKTANATSTPADQSSDAQPEPQESFLQAAGPTNHMTNQHHHSTSEPTTSKI